MTPESKIKADIRAWFLKQGAYVFAPVQTGYGAATVDQLVCFKGRFLGVETKVPGKYPTARQMQTINEIKAAGGTAFWATSLEDMKAQLQSEWGWVL